MPTTFTHYIFGEECKKVLPKHLKSVVEDYRSVFDLGVHGPDIFFYYSFFFKNKVHEYGCDMHFRPAYLYFARCKKVLLAFNEKLRFAKRAGDEKAIQELQIEEARFLSYTLGFLSHFALDSTCHGYVDRKFEVDGPSHNMIEAQYDAYLMRKLSLKPSKVKRYSSLKATKENARTIALSHPFSQGIIRLTILQQIFVLWGMHSPYGIKKWFVRTVLKLLNIQDDLGDLFIDDEELEVCRDSNLRLDKLKALALKRYSALVENFMDYVYKGDKLSSYFKHDFEPWPDYKNIPILPYEEELNFEI